MVEVTIAYSALIILFAWFVVAFGRNAWALIIYGFAALLTYYGLIYPLGLPNPVLPAENSRVLAHHIVRGEAIYVWVLEDTTPRAYVVPWSSGVAEALEKAMREGRGKVILRRRGFWDLNDPMFWPEPQPSKPPKG